MQAQVAENKQKVVDIIEYLSTKDWEQRAELIHKAQEVLGGYIKLEEKVKGVEVE